MYNQGKSRIWVARHGRRVKKSLNPSRAYVWNLNTTGNQLQQSNLLAVSLYAGKGCERLQKPASWNNENTVEDFKYTIDILDWSFISVLIKFIIMIYQFESICASKHNRMELYEQSGAKC